MSRELNIEDLPGRGMGAGLAAGSKRRRQQREARLAGFEQPMQFPESAMRYRQGSVQGMTGRGQDGLAAQTYRSELRLLGTWLAGRGSGCS